MREAIVSKFEGLLSDGIMNGRTAAEIARLIRVELPERIGPRNS